jgi:hypothetical protein
MSQSLLDQLVELMKRDHPVDWARLCHLAHGWEEMFTEIAAMNAKHRIEQPPREPMQMPQGLLGRASTAEDEDTVGVSHDAQAETSLKPEHLPSQHYLDPAPRQSPEEAARTCLRSYQTRGALDPMPMPVEAHSLCGKFIRHFIDVFREQMVGRKKGTRKRKPVDPALVHAWALRFDPDELVLDGGELIIVDLRVEPAPTPLPSPSAPSVREPVKKVRLPAGRPREIDRDAIAGVAKDCAKKGVDESLDGFVERVRHECRESRPAIRAPKSRSQMREICRPTWDAARGESIKK